VRARAPGKLVVSGAYSVLEGAPAIVAAVDRYAIADSESDPPLVTPEVREAFERLGRDDVPGFDASALRSDDRKLGLGSSAAILAASMAVVWSTEVAEGALGEALFPLALESHRKAQGGGSGVDVAAACYGGVLLCELSETGVLSVRRHRLPEDLVVETWACPGAASTSAMLRRVQALKARDPEGYGQPLGAAAAGATAAAEAADAEGFIVALGAQYDALGSLGEAAGVPIVTPEMAAADVVAKEDGARFGPSGAGGGDIALHLGKQPSSKQFRARAEASALCLLELRVGADGVQRLP
jgi:phosphomevalonate kinase